MNLDSKTFGVILLFLTALITYHWYTAHLVKGMLVPELMFPIIVFFGLSIGLLTKEIKIR